MFPPAMFAVGNCPNLRLDEVFLFGVVPWLQSIMLCHVKLRHSSNTVAT